MSKQPYFFVSYSRRDIEVVNAFVARLKKLDIEIWTDVEKLSAGVDWYNAIENALNESAGLLVFISSNSLLSSYVTKEIDNAVHSGIPVLPIVIGDVSTKDIPLNLMRIQWLQVRDLSDQAGFTHAILRIQAWVDGVIKVQKKTLRRAEQVNKIAEGIVQQARGAESGQPRDTSKFPPDSVFVVHGHDDALLAMVKNFLNGIGVRPLVLKEIGGPHQSLLQKFIQYGTATRFAVVLMSGDDYGASLVQYNNQDDGQKIADKALQFRARQNVILELGFFYGLLGWERVFVLYKKPSKIFPNFERPSDLDGIIFDTVDATNAWQGILKSKLTEAGFVLRP